jgi:signal transduction histidine kinase
VADVAADVLVGSGSSVLIVVVVIAVVALVGLSADDAALLAGCSFGAAGVLGMLVLLAELGRARQRIEALAERTRSLEHRGREQLASVSHDLRTPIARMRAMAEALDDGMVDEPGEVRLFHMRLVGEVDRLGQLVDGLLQGSRTDNGTEAIPLCELVSAAVESAAVVAESKGVRLDPYVFDEEPSGAVVARTLALTRGRWKLFCSLNGHEAAGMRATLTVN